MNIKCAMTVGVAVMSAFVAFAEATEGVFENPVINEDWPGTWEGSYLHHHDGWPSFTDNHPRQYEAVFTHAGN